VADFEALHVGDGVERARRSFKRDSQITGARFGLRGSALRQNEQQKKGPQNQAEAICFHRFFSRRIPQLKMSFKKLLQRIETTQRMKNFWINLNATLFCFIGTFFIRGFVSIRWEVL
jgi:hypothetical protein